MQTRIFSLSSQCYSSNWYYILRKRTIFDSFPWLKYKSLTIRGKRPNNISLFLLIFNKGGTKTKLTSLKENWVCRLSSTHLAEYLFPLFSHCPPQCIPVDYMSRVRLPMLVGIFLLIKMRGISLITCIWETVVHVTMSIVVYINIKESE